MCVPLQLKGQGINQFFERKLIQNFHMLHLLLAYGNSALSRPLIFLFFFSFCFCFIMSNKIMSLLSFFHKSALFIYFTLHQNCSGSLNSVLRRCDNKVYFARQASSSFGYFMRQTSGEEVLTVCSYPLCSSMYFLFKLLIFSLAYLIP